MTAPTPHPLETPSAAVIVTGGNASADELRALAAGPPTPEWPRRRS